MQNGALENGFSEQHINDHLESNGYATPNSQSDLIASSETNDQSHLDNGDSERTDNDNDAPPLKRRKLTDPGTRRSASAQRPISPPWKRTAVEGPTSFVEEGRRKSSRTNYVPFELQPQADKRQTRAAIHHGSPTTKSKYGGATAFKSSPLISTSTQVSDNPKQPSSSGKPSFGTKSKSPSKFSLLPTAQPEDLIATPPSDRRSHKKKTPSIPATPKPPMSPHTSNPHQTRRVGRPPNALKTPKKFKAPKTNGSHENDEEMEEQQAEELVKLDPTRKPQRLSLKVRMPAVVVQHPGNIVYREMVGPEKSKVLKFSSFEDFLEKEGRFGFENEDGDTRLTDEQVRQEADLRTRIAEAARSGGLLSQERSQFYRPDRSEAPARLYTHQDRLITHVIYFQKLMQAERSKHLKAAKECAEKAAARVKSREDRSYREWKQVQPKTAEELAQEQREAFRDIYEQLREDLKRKWAMVTDVVGLHRRQRWQGEQDRLGKEALNEAIEKSSGLLNKRRMKRPSEMESNDGSEEADTNGDDGSQGSGSDSESEDEDNMSSSQSESEGDEVIADDDEGLTQEELREKYAVIPSTGSELLLEPPPKERDTVDEHLGRADPALIPSSTDSRADSRDPVLASETPDIERPSPIALDEVDDALMDDSDASTDMDDDMGDSDAFSDEDSSSDGESSEEEQESTGLLGFFGKKAFQTKLVDDDRQDEGPVDDAMSEEETEEVSLIPDITQGPTPSATTSEEPQSQPREEVALHPTSDAVTTINTSAEVDMQNAPPAQHSSAEQPPSSTDLKSMIREVDLPGTPVSTNPLKTPVPSLLRGTLREYQHFGLDWLAGLYANGTNGILADEMGLGKTIQTIALLAHLAIEHEAWGPHLIVVPTSVMLNWEMEFKKFLPGFKVLTYYGTQEERKRKRQGWLDNDKWNVWITSYTLITHDQQIFKRKAWHYMILDEAHNIKNFQSLRWQTLLTFKTRARLLLTGTPLQNNLTELWSLLFFLMPADSSETGIGGFADLQEFTDWFKKPVEQILEHGRETMDDDARAIVAKLHKILRPYLLRRLKADVEKQMPGKYEHVVYCRLSKRQRYLYDGFMSRAQTRETLASGNTFSIMNALMQLRKVCNHPDLFETRQIVTSFAMPKSAVAEFEIKELLVRRRLLQDDPINIVDLNVINLLPGANEQFSALDSIQRQRLGALGTIRQLTTQQWGRIDHKLQFDGSTVNSTLKHFENNARHTRFEELRHASYLTSLRSQRRPLYSHSLMERLRFGVTSLPHPKKPESRKRLSEWYSNMSPALSEMVLTLPERSISLETTVSKFACVTPSVVATDMAPLALSRKGVEVVQSAKQLCPQDPYHKARMRLSIAFPDKRLLQYDCGKLQKLDTLLRTLQAGGHRALIFTQMTRVLDILEQFLNIHGHRYLRLDGATKIEQRQVMTERFNNDNRILAFILSSRSGGIGINLTGADTVIFYDLDWNPAMDKQCQDRCHRIGQTRDVHIYRLVSEYTIEANILRKANQKRMLDDVVIQEGDFTTDYFNNMSVKDVIGDSAFDDGDAEANAAMDRVLGGRPTGRVFEAVEDQEDIAAAKVAEKEITQIDATDFDEKGLSSSAGATAANTPGPPTPGELMPPPGPVNRNRGDTIERTTTMDAAESGLGILGTGMEEEIEELPSCDEYMMRFLEWELKDVPVQPPEKKKKLKPKGKEHSLRKR